MKPKLNSRTISVVIKNKDGVVFEGDAKALTSINEKGIFDVLPLHENFVSVVRDFIRIHKANGTSQDIKIGEGVIKVIQNKVNVYVGFRA
ncbi:MAG: hypothetical protein A3C30_02530 [Candidatus Levybacteria bacterium RIFCSPHIGHO2_02_FULL_40_18]|nr:MAG: hypothetical protein A2869_05445 [Candidatus Levybacteria bacterium RIFCSPHIGHO2_01_FULL_40_58]OGH26854.1 MAG: hypothetical protein A3C30_02530 [Candidatus Levybacteria bacterium RIFCSPHIGHO2_02_FULL_40_18]OGH31976.1 MAG: hypothetical protein A3E43_03510 [Candidatus Levybacteria bacterium RIFCSPHIGHO2_12_FULL_40_31]OGH40902.1 MAG: hypothetical protein A2894_04890 [Candidatus Levybacteria bacterium RIFCSPLOWO2_01_FULL_40_64]OGH49530.1 MAG: hypothetical protein A3I54_00055 [Candidatus Lev